MRWDELFDDLEAQYEREREVEHDLEVSDRARREIGLVRLVDRVRPAVGGLVSVRVSGAGLVEGVLVSAGADWLLLNETAGRELLIAAHAVMAIGGLAAQSSSAAEQGRVAARLTLAFALRGLVRDRLPVGLVYTDGATTAGTLDRVGQDFVEIAEHPVGELRRRGVVRAVRTVPLAAVAAVRRA